MPVQQKNSIEHCGYLLNYYFDDLDIESLFEKGMPLQGKSLNYHDHYFTPAINGTTIEEHIEHTMVSNPSSRYAVILQIPPKYLGKTCPKFESDYSVEGEERKGHYPVVPLLDRDFTSDGETHRVTPNVIVGYLDTKTGNFIQNPNYNLYFEPSGLRYTSEQIDFLREHNPELYYEATRWRATAPRDVLIKTDRENNVFKNTVNYYKNEKPHQNNVRCKS